MFEDTIFYHAQRQVTLNLKLRSGLNSNKSCYSKSAYLQVLKRSEFKWPRTGIAIFSHARGQLTGIRSKFKKKNIQALMHALVAYKNEDQTKIKVLQRQQHLSHWLFLQMLKSS